MKRFERCSHAFCFVACACADDEVVRMRGLSMRSDAAADLQAHRWERACMIMPAGLVQGSEGAPEEASLCMVPRGERF